MLNATLRQFSIDADTGTTAWIGSPRQAENVARKEMANRTQI